MFIPFYLFVDISLVIFALVMFLLILSEENDQFILPLTSQPVVENAIKHGLDPDADPLHISVKTCKTDTGSLIVIEDNGKGFEPKDNNNM